MPSTVLSLCTLYAKSNRKRRQGNDKDSGCSGRATETCWYGRKEESTNDQRRPSSIIEYTLMQYKHTHTHIYMISLDGYDGVDFRFARFVRARSSTNFNIRSKRMFHFFCVCVALYPPYTTLLSHLSLYFFIVRVQCVSVVLDLFWKMFSTENHTIYYTECRTRYVFFLLSLNLLSVHIACMWLMLRLCKVIVILLLLLLLLLFASASFRWGRLAAAAAVAAATAHRQ